MREISKLFFAPHLTRFSSYCIYFVYCYNCVLANTVFWYDVDDNIIIIITVIADIMMPYHHHSTRVLFIGIHWKKKLYSLY